MNLKERQNKEKKRPEISNDTTQTSNPLSDEQTLLSKTQELSAKLAAATDALEREKKRSRAQDLTISKLTSQNSTLTSKTQEQQLLIAALRTEISDALDINRSLLEDNQALIQANGGLRSDRGIESRKEVADLRSEITRLESEICDLKTQVDQSCVAAVQKAYDKLERSRRKADRQLDSYQAFVEEKIRGILEERNQSVAALNHKIKALTGSLWLSRDLLLICVLCNLVANPVILQDLWDILLGIDLLLAEYFEWIRYPCYHPYPGSEPYPYAPWPAWAIRIVSIVAGLSLVAGIACLCSHMYDQIRSQWCRLAARITTTLLIIVSILGPMAKEYLHWNTAALSFIFFLFAMKRLHRFEVSYSRAHKTEKWEHIKQHNDKSFYVTYHINHLYALIKEKIKKVGNKST